MVVERDPDDSEDHLDLDQMPVCGNDKDTALVIGQRETFVQDLGVYSTIHRIVHGDNRSIST